ncbi:DEAD/DEAH box helicase [Planomicrobium sp. Y74]|uniref:DEAD/DEAH box helicase n=1 Tax=Planomicrobium sp. Y74 TaxID=2478977 RepID=UPI000EF48890|nr:DEAD/DEAH box helicase [Planomicrobium sp. Y74]RLQ91329.1 DEAD/DEAH box helicase [Planomicrobium sp. Y74]
MNFDIEDLYIQDAYDLEYSFLLAKSCSILLRSENEKKGREIIIAILDNWEKLNEETHDIWRDLVEASGFYPYLSQERLPGNLDTSSQIRANYHLSSNLKNFHLHEEQKELLNLIENRRNVVVSAPTSFGKSLLIEEIIASNSYRNIVIIQPTLALLNETFLKLKKYKAHYNIILKSTQEVEADGQNIFIFTAERVMEYQNLPLIDIVIIDEFYKLSAKRDDERYEVLNNAANLLLNKHQAQFYFLGPNIDNISKGFIEKYNAVFYKTDYTMVNNQIIDLYSIHEKKLNQPGKIKFKENLLFELLDNLKESQTIIYCSSPNRARKMAVKFIDYLTEKKALLNQKELRLISWIKNNINEDWSFNNLLSNGVGVHNGALPKHINNSVINYFNEGELNYLFCTSTIIEGVNTSAKNVVIFDENKGTNPIDFFDFNNIKGRSGRMMQHYLGKVYLFNKKPFNEIISIDIPFFDQVNLTDEVLINLSESDLKDGLIDRYRDLEKNLDTYYEVVKKNNVSIEGQIGIIRKLEKEIPTNPHNVLWSGIPNYNQLEFVINLGWEYLIKEGETTRPMTPKKLIFVANNYGKKNSFQEALKAEFIHQRKQTSNSRKNNTEVLDESILNVMQMDRHWLRYKLPKWLNVINSLQKEVCARKGIDGGDYGVYANLLENDFVRANLSLLIDLGVPSSAIFKLEKLIPKDLPTNDLIKFIKDNNIIYTSNLTEYEKVKISDIF